MTFNYERDIPDGPNNPSADQPLMKINTNSIDDLIAVDHISFNTANGGYHTVIHQKAQGADPALIALVGQLYTKSVTIVSPASTKVELFYENDIGEVTKLSGGVAASSGYAYVSGGMILQWGSNVVNSAGTTTITFPIPYVSPAFSITLAGTSLVTTTYKVSSITALDFIATGSVNGSIRWMAIGK